uniref:Uncharacterized protein n=1 Tax=Trichuris muris TaxID=70415 RepID=A0A5S6QN26_TRIMR
MGESDNQTRVLSSIAVHESYLRLPASLIVSRTVKRAGNRTTIGETGRQHKMVKTVSCEQASVSDKRRLF